MAQHVSSIIHYLVQTDQAPLHGNICPRQPGSILDDTCVQAAIPTQSSLTSLWLVQAEVLWLMHAKHRWLAGDVKGARDIMDEVHCPIRTALIKMHACMLLVYWCAAGISAGSANKMCDDSPCDVSLSMPSQLCRLSMLYAFSHLANMLSLQASAHSFLWLHHLQVVLQHL